MFQIEWLHENYELVTPEKREDWFPTSLLRQQLFEEFPSMKTHLESNHVKFYRLVAAAFKNMQKKYLTKK